MITLELLCKLAPKGVDLEQHAAALEEARKGSTINTPRRLAAFLGQVYVETAGLTRTEENLRYTSPARLDAVFRAVRGIEDAKALIAKGPKAIANRVYANRLGNGDEASGDGWRYRGSGYKQLTGRWNYRDMGRITGLPVEDDPAMAREPFPAARLAFAFWDARNCSELADQGDIEGITALVNGPAKLGLAERREATIQALDILD